MRRRIAALVFALCPAASFADTLDLSAIDRIATSDWPPFEGATFCRQDFQVCWDVALGGKRTKTVDTRERFFGRTNVVFAVVSASAITLDGMSTLPNLGKIRQYYSTDPAGNTVIVARVFQENNRLMMPFVKHPAAFYGVQSAIHAGMLTASWKLRRANTGTKGGKILRVIGFVLPIVWDVGQFYLADRNFKLARKFSGAPGVPTGP